jgi:hypothetical protein
MADHDALPVEVLFIGETTGGTVVVGRSAVAGGVLDDTAPGIEFPAPAAGGATTAQGNGDDAGATVALALRRAASSCATAVAAAGVVFDPKATGR